MIKIISRKCLFNYFCHKNKQMIKNFIPLIDWGMGVIGGVFLFVVFGGLALMLILFMRSGKKKNKE